jgi:energy-coupling factor transport system permease protein
MLAYIGRKSPLHSLSGAVKLIVFLFWSVLTMVGYDTRIMGALALVSVILFVLSRVRFGEVAFVFKMMVVFLVLNLAAVYVFAPEQGVLIYKTRHVLAGSGRFTLTAEQLFYEFNIFLKYLMIIPPAILLMVTTHPSEFAASLNRIGVPYSVAYAVSLTMRYIPDVQRDYQAISQAQQARGFSSGGRKADGRNADGRKAGGGRGEKPRKGTGKNNPLSRLKGAARFLLPLIFSSLDRIDVISRAMELRGFGKYKKRTWYSARPFTTADFLTLILAAALFAFGIWFTFRDGDRFYNPFIRNGV